MNPVFANQILVGPVIQPWGAWDLAVDETADRIYFSRQEANTVTVIDTATDSVLDEISIASPVAVAVNPTLGHVYVVQQGVSLLYVYDSSTLGLITTVPVGTGPIKLAVNEALDTVYVANSGSQSISVVRADTLTNVNSLSVANPRQMGVNPATGTLYVTNLLRELVVISDYGLDSTFGVETVEVGDIDFTERVLVNPATNRVYIDVLTAIAVVDGATNEVTETLPYRSTRGINPVEGIVYMHTFTPGEEMYLLDAVTHAVITTADVHTDVLNTVTGLLYKATTDSGSIYLYVYDDDSDVDGIGDHGDNCPADANPGQEDTDGDGEGDACDPDDDNDGVADTSDNCPLVVNAGQENAVHPGTFEGDACEDPDADGVADATDNCPDDANPSQSDNDGDSAGDACDPDDDNDTVADTLDNCQFVMNAGQAEGDGDGVGDACDNCPDTPNAGQADFDGDLIGDACDDDIDGDGLLNGSDPDADGDLVRDANEGPCGSDPLNPLERPERVDGIFAGTDDDGDTQVDEALPAGAEGYDCDGDGYTGAVEAYVFGGVADRDQDACGTGGWPGDFVSGGVPDSTNKLNILDLASFAAPVRYVGTNIGTNPGDVRWDVSPGPGPLGTDINVIDIATFGAPGATTGAPPMLGGARAFLGPACPWAP